MPLIGNTLTTTIDESQAISATDSSVVLDENASYFSYVNNVGPNPTIVVVGLIAVLVVVFVVT